MPRVREHLGVIEANKRSATLVDGESGNVNEAVLLWVDLHCGGNAGDISQRTPDLEYASLPSSVAVVVSTQRAALTPS